MNKQNSKPDGQHDSWMPEDDELLRKHYKDIGLKVASLLPGRAIHTPNKRKSQPSQQHEPWTSEEKEILREHYSGMGLSLLPG